MFVAIAHFPEVSAERRAGLEAWFAWSNDELREVDGLTGRRLLRASDGTYVAVVEHESAQTFAAMSATGVAAHVQSRLRKILKEVPQTATLEVVVDLATSGSCCGGTGDDGGGAHQRPALAVVTAAAGSGGCCRG
ncbi:hypothetical protein [Pengzhenrongella frigida]|uniref:ABM domain-containing protein n=1 Tax=Pengzhenrongella frigida TaxID=1259133 RepID=A0A4Q5MUV3_9MICO|nr:hypothetical protein [Cellulomonas sp. HLT2-17]RYV49336.1 hypothetical protein EUA98_19355 [Cellulomonas sp. HLT2-17]